MMNLSMKYFFLVLYLIIKTCHGYIPWPIDDNLKALKDCRHSTPLGMITGTIKNWQISSSSVYQPELDANCAERFARLYQPDKKGWCAKYKSSSEWLQVDLGLTTKVTGVMTQGRCDGEEWVSVFSISYSIDNVNWVYVDDDNVQKVFEGNMDSCSVKHVYMEEAVYARFLKIHILKWNKHPSMRIEIIGCQRCNTALGMPPYGKLTSSSEKLTVNDSSCQSHHAYILTNKAWCPRRDNVNQWLQYDIGPPSLVTGVVTRGRGDEYRQHWVTRYMLSFSNDSIQWHFYKSAADSSENFIFSGNSDKDSEFLNYLDHPIRARFFRFHPTEWHRHIAMRVGLIGCYHEGSCPEEFMRVNEDAPCVENLAYKKSSWISSKPTQRKRNARHQYQWTKAAPLTPATPVLVGQVSNNNGSHGDGTGVGVSSCVILDNFLVERPIWLVDLRRKAHVAGVVIKTPISVASNKEEEIRYQDYMHDLDKLIIYLDDHDKKEDISTPEAICGVVTASSGSFYRPRIHVTCRSPTRARYVYVEAWGLEKRHGRLFSATLCDVEIYE